MAEAKQVPVATKDDVEKNKVYGILAYLGILCLIPLLAAKDSPFARFHANQGLVLFLGEVIFGVIANILTFSLALTGMWWLIGMVLPLVWLAMFVLAIIGIINAAQGEMKKLPVIGDIVLVK